MTSPTSSQIVESHGLYERHLQSRTLCGSINYWNVTTLRHNGLLYRAFQ